MINIQTYIKINHCYLLRNSDIASFLKTVQVDKKIEAKYTLIGCFVMRSSQPYNVIAIML